MMQITYTSQRQRIAELEAKNAELLAACKLASESLTEAITALRVAGNALSPNSTYQALKADREKICAVIANKSKANQKIQEMHDETQTQ